MDRSTICQSFGLLLALTATGLGAPVQWTIASGGNGHNYDLVAPPEGISWTEARDAAAASLFNGFSGHLVTINSQEEWNFVIASFPREWTWIGLSDEAQQGNFQWVTDEPVTFTRWIPGEPNNTGGLEHYVFYQLSTALGGEYGWNDFFNSPNVFTGSLPIGYIVEYVPEPSTIVLAAMGAIFAVAFRRPRPTHY